MLGSLDILVNNFLSERLYHKELLDKAVQIANATWIL